MMIDDEKDDPVPQCIDCFSGDFGFLSNFHEASLWLDGVQYRSVEHAYQAAKTSDPSAHELIRSARTPGMAKRLGKAVQLPADWNTKKLTVMHRLLQEKFRNPLLRSLLLATNDATLVEGNTWGDRFWGVYKGVGDNHLGKLLMQVRDECRTKDNVDC